MRKQKKRKQGGEEVGVKNGLTRPRGEKKKC